MNNFFLRRINQIRLPYFDEAFFWIIDLKNIIKEEIKECKKIVDSKTINYSSQFAFLEEQERSLLTHTLVRLILGDHFKITPEIERDRFNKPFLKNTNYHFNLSHTKEWAFLAIHPCPIGIDIESSAAEIEGDFWLSLQEKALLKGLPLISAWCAKESLIKAGGNGFLGKVPEFSEIIEIEPAVQLFKADKQKVFVFSEIVEGQILAVSLALKEKHECSETI